MVCSSHSNDLRAIVPVSGEPGHNTVLISGLFPAHTTKYGCRAEVVPRGLFESRTRRRFKAAFSCLSWVFSVSSSAFSKEWNASARALS